jgi:hypothetical protein
MWDSSDGDPQAACVGILGVSFARVANSPVWGGVLQASELPGQNSPVAGLEIDIGVYTDGVGQSQPTKNGLQINKVGTAAASNAIILHDTTGDRAGFNYGLYVDATALADGGSAITVAAQTGVTPSTGIDLGSASFSACALCINNNNSIRLKGTGANDTQLYVNGSNTTIIQSSGGDTQIQSSTGTANFTVTNSGALAAPALKSTSGTRYLCINSTGVISSSASPCSGT